MDVSTGPKDASTSEPIIPGKDNVICAKGTNAPITKSTVNVFKYNAYEDDKRSSIEVVSEIAEMDNGGSKEPIISVEHCYKRNKDPNLTLDLEVKNAVTKNCGIVISKGDDEISKDDPISPNYTLEWWYDIGPSPPPKTGGVDPKIEYDISSERKVQCPALPSTPDELYSRGDKVETEEEDSSQSSVFLHRNEERRNVSGDTSINILRKKYITIDKACSFSSRSTSLGSQSSNAEDRVSISSPFVCEASLQSYPTSCNTSSMQVKDDAPTSKVSDLSCEEESKSVKLKQKNMSSFSRPDKEASTMEESGVLNLSLSKSDQINPAHALPKSKHSSDQPLTFSNFAKRAAYPTKSVPFQKYSTLCACDHTQPLNLSASANESTKQTDCPPHNYDMSFPWSLGLRRTSAALPSFPQSTSLPTSTSLPFPKVNLKSNLYNAHVVMPNAPHGFSTSHEMPDNCHSHEKSGAQSMVYHPFDTSTSLTGNDAPLYNFNRNDRLTSLDHKNRSDEYKLPSFQSSNLSLHEANDSLLSARRAIPLSTSSSTSASDKNLAHQDVDCEKQLYPTPNSVHNEIHNESNKPESTKKQICQNEMADNVDDDIINVCSVDQDASCEVMDEQGPNTDVKKKPKVSKTKDKGTAIGGEQRSKVDDIQVAEDISDICILPGRDTRSKKNVTDSTSNFLEAHDFLDPTQIKLYQDDGEDQCDSENSQIQEMINQGDNSSDEDWMPERRRRKNDTDYQIEDDDSISSDYDSGIRKRRGNRNKGKHRSHVQYGRSRSINQDVACSTCGKIFQGRYHLKRHEMSHTETRPFECLTCGKRFKQKAHLQGHQSVHIRQKSTSKQRGKRSTTVNMTDNQEETALKIKCNKPTGRPKKNYSEKELSCNICLKSFKTLYRLKRHVQSHTDERPYSCRICGKGFKQTGHRNEHEANHEKNRRKFLCKTCGVIFRCRSSFNNHLKIHKNGPHAVGNKDNTNDADTNLSIVSIGDEDDAEYRETSKVGEEANRTVYDCPYCSDKFSTAQGLNRHLDSHSEVHQRLHVQPYTCKHCSRSFTYKHNLLKHMLSHLAPEKYALYHKSKLEQHLASGKPCFKCATCSKMFIRKETLVKHAKIHTGFKPYKCLVCRKEFSQNVHLKVHMRKHTGNRPFQCKRCNRGFIDSTSLAKHIEYEACINENVFYVCKLCEKRHYYLGSIKQHIQKSHKGADIEECIQRVQRRRPKLKRLKNNSSIFTCEVCFSTFTEKGNLVRHVKRKHKELMKLIKDENRHLQVPIDRVNQDGVSTFTRDANVNVENENTNRGINQSSNSDCTLHNNCTLNLIQFSMKETKTNTNSNILVGDPASNSYTNGNSNDKRASEDTCSIPLNVSSTYSTVNVIPGVKPLIISPAHTMTPSTNLVDISLPPQAHMSQTATEKLNVKGCEQSAANFLSQLGLMAANKVRIGDHEVNGMGQITSLPVQPNLDIQRRSKAHTQQVNGSLSTDPHQFLKELQVDSLTTTVPMDLSLRDINGKQPSSDLELFCHFALMSEYGNTSVTKGTDSCFELKSGSESSNYMSKDKPTAFNNYNNVEQKNSQNTTILELKQGNTKTEDHLFTNAYENEGLPTNMDDYNSRLPEIKPWLVKLLAPPERVSKKMTSNKNSKKLKTHKTSSTNIAPKAPNPSELNNSERDLSVFAKVNKRRPVNTYSLVKRSMNHLVTKATPSIINVVDNDVSTSNHETKPRKDTSSCPVQDQSGDTHNQDIADKESGVANSNTSIVVSCDNHMNLECASKSSSSTNMDPPPLVISMSDSNLHSSLPASPLMSETTTQTATNIHNDNHIDVLSDPTSEPEHPTKSKTVLGGESFVHTYGMSTQDEVTFIPMGQSSLSREVMTQTHPTPPKVVMIKPPGYSPPGSTSTGSLTMTFLVRAPDGVSSVVRSGNHDQQQQVIVSVDHPSHCTDRPKPKAPFPCLTCGKCFNARHQLKRHEMTHTEIRPYGCPECGRAFRQKVHLSDHLKRHGGERPFVCQACGKRFVLKNELKQHAKNYCRKNGTATSNASVRRDYLDTTSWKSAHIFPVTLANLSDQMLSTISGSGGNNIIQMQTSSSSNV